MVNGAKLVAQQRQELTAGDELHIGQNKFRFEPNVPADPEEENISTSDDASESEGGRV